MTEEKPYISYFERKLEAYENRKYQNVLTIFKEEYGEELGIYMAICFLDEKLQTRVKIIERVRDLYRIHNLETLEKYDRERFIKRFIKRRRIGCMDFDREWKLLNYPYYMLNVTRLKKSPKELQYLNKWGLKYIPKWVDWKKGQEPYVLKNHSGGVLIQFLGSDGKYSTQNSKHYETKIIFNPF